MEHTFGPSEEMASLSTDLVNAYIPTVYMVDYRMFRLATPVRWSDNGGTL